MAHTRNRLVAAERRRFARCSWAVALAFVFSAPVLGCGDDPPERPGALTYWQDMVPLFEQHCLQCHREGGIAPMRLDQYSQAKTYAAAIEQETRERHMPPWAVTSDGSCGNFSDSRALSDDELARIADWVRGGAQEGTPGDVRVPQLPTLSDATALQTPNFVPEIEGGELAENDEYRCFLFDAPIDQTAFITAYDVVPGRAEIVHHVIVDLVDPDALSEDPSGRTNAQQMRMLDDASPDRAGWPCFSGSGEGVRVAAAPVLWAPGQGVVHFPEGSGLGVPPNYKLVVQIHYNLADPATRGLSDQTTIRLHFEPQVENYGLFVLIDPMMDSMESGDRVELPPGQASAKYSWTKTGSDLQFEEGRKLRLRGIMPHMHQLGHKYQMTLAAADESPHCMADIQDWDFHWQRLYFYEQPTLVDRQTSLSVTCDYDTSGVSKPVTPGWGTGDEMCTTALYFTIPRSEVDVGM